MPIRPTENPTILAMRGLNLFHYSYSNCSMRIRLFLDEKGIPWNDQFVDLRAQKNLTEEYFAIHPQGLVPALVDDGVIVYESADILEYLENKFPEPSLIPEDPEDRAALEKILEFTRSGSKSSGPVASQLSALKAASNGSTAISSGLTSSSTIWFTKELFAPFSSNRRTR